MNDRGRIENSIRNSLSGIIVQACSILMGFATRTVFIKHLSLEYLGVNGLFSNILTMLSLAEMGVGSAITYSMYKPVAERDEIKIAQLMNLYRTAYQVIGTLIAVSGLCIVPFLSLFIKEKPNIDNLEVIYLLFLGNTVASYFFAYKQSVLNTDQMARVIHYFSLAFQVLRYTSQIIVVILFKDFILYLVVQIACTLFENCAISFYVDRRYPFLKQYRDQRVDDSEKKTIFENIKALVVYKIGSTALDGTDNIIISAFDGIIKIGLLSNYGLITGSLQTFLYRVSNGLTGSVGNYIAKENEGNHEQLLQNITFVYFILYGAMFVGCIGVLNPFMSVWVGEKCVLSFDIVFIHCLNIYIYGMMNSVWTFRATMGLFIYGRWRPLVSAVINIIVSILLAKRIGLLGVLLGTTITRLVTNTWFDPYIVYKYGLKKSPISYYIKWAEYLLVIIANAMILHYMDMLLRISGVHAVIFYGLLSIVLFGLSIVVLFHRSTSFIYLKNLSINLCKTIAVKIGLE